MSDKKVRLVAFLLFLVCAATVYFSITILIRRSAIEYTGDILQSYDACPGDTISFSTTVSIKEAPVTVFIYESWCQENGICPYNLSTENPPIAISKPYSLSATIRRVIPDLSPGVWNLNHNSEAHFDGTFSLQSWTVRVNVLDCKDK